MVGLKIATGEQLSSYVLVNGTLLTFSGGMTGTVVGDTGIGSGGETLVTVTASGPIAAAETADLSVNVGEIPLIVLDPDTASLALPAGTVLAFSPDGSIFTVTEPTVISQTIASDYDSDGVVNMNDYDTWGANFGQTGQNIPGDGNGDGVVDAADYTVWANNNGTVVSVASVKGILPPGPATANGATATVGTPGYRVHAELLTTAAFDGSTVGLKIDETVFTSFTLRAGQICITLGLDT
ncbi:hypothetical protein LCGC14_1852300 [marine sediment metagenome]|uniref:Dockerin domain-containing protein n=1 Tax=marine sediment metagenome TaxID=412755 RepID=A0A0F9J951_9ZZZZ